MKKRSKLNKSLIRLNSTARDCELFRRIKEDTSQPSQWEELNLLKMRLMPIWLPLLRTQHLWKMDLLSTKFQRCLSNKILGWRPIKASVISHLLIKMWNRCSSNSSLPNSSYLHLTLTLKVWQKTHSSQGFWINLRQLTWAWAPTSLQEQRRLRVPNLRALESALHQKGASLVKRNSKLIAMLLLPL